MHLIAVLLPLYDNGGHPLSRELFAQVAAELTGAFGGLTAHTRAPAQGLWRPDEHPQPTRDDIVIYEVMVENIDRDWWTNYRTRLEQRFRQEQVLIRAHEVDVL